MHEFATVMRTVTTMIDVALVFFALPRAIIATGVERYLRVTVTLLAGGFAYGSTSSIAQDVPPTDRTYVGWIANFGCLIALGLAIRAEHRSQPHD